MVEGRLLLSSRDASEHVKQRDCILKRKKDTKGSRVWDQVWDDSGEEVFGVVCYANCKKCFIYKKLIEGQVRSMGTKNLLDYLKHCMAL